jgi:hypothetical protein
MHTRRVGVPLPLSLPDIDTQVLHLHIISKLRILFDSIPIPSKIDNHLIAEQRTDVLHWQALRLGDQADFQHKGRQYVGLAVSDPISRSTSNSWQMPFSKT